MDINTSFSVGVAIGIAVFLFFTLYSSILIFHWHSYSMKPATAAMATILYLSVSAVFFFGMLAGISAL